MYDFAEISREITSSIFVDKTLKHFRCSFVICVKSTPMTLNNVSSNQSPLTESTENTDF